MLEAQQTRDNLVRTGLFVQAISGGSEERMWLDCDLAALAEHRLAEVIDPRSLNTSQRSDWQARAQNGPQVLRSSIRGDYEPCYWIQDGGERAGTLSLATSTLGGAALRVSSFYVLPHCRGKGLGRRVLQCVQQTLAKDNLGLKLHSDWSWLRTVRFCLSAGLWVYMWKHDLTFCSFPDTPQPQVFINDHEASIAVAVNGELHTLMQATRCGDAIQCEEPTWESIREAERWGEAGLLASSTLSLSMALHGWPLIRSPEMYKSNCYCDGGPPEALARKIAIWEAWDRKHGWMVDAPRIPGLEYPSWDELEAKWAAQRTNVRKVVSEEPKDDSE